MSSWGELMDENDSLTNKIAELKSDIKALEIGKEGCLKIAEKRFEENKLLKQLLARSVCPNLICIDGSIPVQVGPDCWEAEQCQFCHEKGEILK